MANLTLSVDEDVLRRARIRALERGTSVNAVLREFLAAYAGASDEQQRAVRSLLHIAGRLDAVYAKRIGEVASAGGCRDGSV